MSTPTKPNRTGKTGETTKSPPSASTVVLLLGTIGDTTWRMFIPTIGLTIAGVYGDNLLKTKPWLTVTGIVFGIIVAALLVRKQLKNAGSQ